MKYTYYCPVCGYTVRDVPVDDRDLQACDCGTKLERVFEATSNICIPNRFTMDRGNLDAVTAEGKRRVAESVPYERLDNA